MANTYFQFKQFIIQQDKCAMKVCTDACLFGAWTAKEITGKTFRNILDIGTGTGLLSLMLAQETNARIDAVEINEDAALQAVENIAASHWKNRVEVLNIALQDFKPSTKYDLIVSNPPFFEGDLKATGVAKNLAKHDSGLALNELMFFVKDHLADEGIFSLLVPFHRSGYVAGLGEANGLFIRKKMLVKQSPGHDFFRSVFLFSKQKPGLTENTELVIHDHERNYTAPFIELLKNYYLNF